MLGAGLLQLWCQRWHHSCRQNFANMQNLQNRKKLLSVIALSMSQEINKTETLSHGISKVTILQNCKLSRLEFTTSHGISRFADLQKQKISKTGTSQHGICEVPILVDQHIDKNCLIHVQFYSFKDARKENKQSKSLQFSEVRNSTKHTLFTYSVQDF